MAVPGLERDLGEQGLAEMVAAELGVRDLLPDRLRLPLDRALQLSSDSVAPPPVPGDELTGLRIQAELTALPVASGGIILLGSLLKPVA